MAVQLLNTAKQWVREHLKVVYVATAIVATIAVYSILFIVPRTVQFSYAKPTACTLWPTLFPSSMQTLGSKQFNVEFEESLKIGGVVLFSDTTCVSPASTPKAGDITVAAAPFGGWLFRQHVQVSVPGQPVASASTIQKPVPTTKPLTIKLDQADSVHRYTLWVGEQNVPCKSSEEPSIQCDIVPLDLEQGKEYSFEVTRRFKNEPTISVLKSNVTTLTATSVIDNWVKPGEMVYTRPTELRFTTDKLLKKATVSIAKDGVSEKIVLTTKVEGASIVANLAKELDREKAYTLTIDNVEAEDGSSLADPYVVGFQTSGGPKVINVSVGKTGVALGATITVTFDQELSATQDIGKIATLNGGAARITKGSNYISYTLQSIGQCADFTLAVGVGMLSKYDIASSASWSYGSRTICHTTSIYGYSVRGRALVAYTFGASGPVTMYVGAIHGNEPSSSGLMKAWIDDLEANSSLYSGKRVVVVPTINPDGVAANSRTNARGVNLNRNFPTDGWTKDINDTDGRHAGGGGSEPLSEPEAKALASLTTSHRPRLLLSYHAVGSLVTGDPGGYSAGYASKYASLVGYRDATGQAGTFDYDITGAYEDWTYSKQGISSMVIELGSYGYYNFEHHRAAIRSMLN